MKRPEHGRHRLNTVGVKESVSKITTSDANPDLWEVFRRWAADCGYQPRTLLRHAIETVADDAINTPGTPFNPDALFLQIRDNYGETPNPRTHHHITYPAKPPFVTQKPMEFAIRVNRNMLHVFKERVVYSGYQPSVVIRHAIETIALDLVDAAAPTLDPGFTPDALYPRILNNYANTDTMLNRSDTPPKPVIHAWYVRQYPPDPDQT